MFQNVHRLTIWTFYKSSKNVQYVVLAFMVVELLGLLAEVWVWSRGFKGGDSGRRLKVWKVVTRYSEKLWVFPEERSVEL